MQKSIPLSKNTSAIPFPLAIVGTAFYRLFLAALDVYLLGILAYFAARPLLGDAFWYVNLINNFVQWLLLPTIPVTLFLIWRRHRVRALGWFTLLLIFGFMYGALFLPGRSQAAPEGAKTLRVMSYNVAVEFAAPDDLLQSIRESDADMVGLVELGRGQAAVLENQLQDEYPYRILFGYGVPGVGLLSRYPIQDYETFNVTLFRPYIKAHLLVDGETLTVFVAHPPRPEFYRSRKLFGDHPDMEAHINALLAEISVDEPTLVMGDFNMTDQSQYHDRMQDAGLIDSYHEVGWGFGATFPAKFAPFPLVRIDYIWSTTHFQPLKSYIGADAGSDHLPLISEFAWVK